MGWGSGVGFGWVGTGMNYDTGSERRLLSRNKLEPFETICGGKKSPGPFIHIRLPY